MGKVIVYSVKIKSDDHALLTLQRPPQNWFIRGEVTEIEVENMDAAIALLDGE